MFSIEDQLILQLHVFGSIHGLGVIVSCGAVSVMLSRSVDVEHPLGSLRDQPWCMVAYL